MWGKYALSAAVSTVADRVFLIYAFWFYVKFIFYVVKLFRSRRYLILQNGTEEVNQLFFPGKKEKANRDLVEQIILKKYNQYYRLAYSYVHNEADACDIVQNGAYKAIRGSRTLRQPEYTETWVYRIMLNECFGYAGTPRCCSFEQMQEENGTEAGAVDTYENIDLHRALDTLPAEDRAVIFLKYFEDKKLEEIADILDENVNTVKSRLYRCLKKLRGILADESGQEKGLKDRALISSKA